MFLITTITLERDRRERKNERRLLKQAADEKEMLLSEGDCSIITTMGFTRFMLTDFLYSFGVKQTTAQF